jgi:hypothetical protein
LLVAFCLVLLACVLAAAFWLETEDGSKIMKAAFCFALRHAIGLAQSMMALS